MTPHPSHHPLSSTPTLGQRLDCNPPLPLKLAVGEEFRASRLPTFIKGCCFPPPQLPCCPSPPNTCCGQKPSDEVGSTWPPSLSSGPHVHLPPAWEGVPGPRPCSHHQPMSSGLEVNRAVTGRLRPASAQGRWWFCLEKGRAESPGCTRFESVPFPIIALLYTLKRFEQGSRITLATTGPDVEPDSWNRGPDPADSGFSVAPQTLSRAPGELCVDLVGLASWLIATFPTLFKTTKC